VQKFELAAEVTAEQRKQWDPYRILTNTSKFVFSLFGFLAVLNNGSPAGPLFGAV
jgi:hypothetical protein